MPVSPKIHVKILTSQWNGLRKWGLGEVIRL